MKKLLFLLCVLPSFCRADIKHPPLQVNNNGSIFYGYYYLLNISGPSELVNQNDGKLILSCFGIDTRNRILLEDATTFLLEDDEDLIAENP